MQLTPLIFNRQFSRFDKQIHSQSGSNFTSFKEGLPARWEGYKEDLRKEALYQPDVRSWKRRELGKGRILARVIDVIEINLPSRRIRNNLVDWPNRYGHKHLSHKALLDAKSDRTMRYEFEKWFFAFFKSSRPEEKAFEEFRELAGNRYDLVAYLFFLKDWDRFMPIVPTTFDKAFRLFGSDLVTSGRCSWPNYTRYNEHLLEVQRALRDFRGMHDARLIDAHSFCWMLIRLKLPPATQETIIPMPVEVHSLKGAVNSESEIYEGGEFTTIDKEEFFNKHARNHQLGMLAQDIALRSERKRLAKLGLLKANAVKDVSDQPKRGFDILPRESNGNERLIEVKAARRSGGRLSFCLTDYEWRVSQKRRNYYFYLVLYASTVRPKVLMIHASRLRQQYLKPTNYVASFGATF
jgi:hypothetical protein